MIELACFLEDHYINIFSANLEIQMDAYFTTALSFGISKVKLVDLTQWKFGRYYAYNTSQIEMEYYDDFTTFVDIHVNYDKPVVFICQNITDFTEVSYVNLIYYNHPEDVLYIIPPNFSKYDLNLFKDKMTFVRPLNWDCYLFTQQYLAIVMYDRLLKAIKG